MFMRRPADYGAIPPKEQDPNAHGPLQELLGGKYGEMSTTSEFFRASR